MLACFNWIVVQAEHSTESALASCWKCLVSDAGIARVPFGRQQNFPDHCFCQTHNHPFMQSFPLGLLIEAFDKEILTFLIIAFGKPTTTPPHAELSLMIADCKARVPFGRQQNFPDHCFCQTHNHLFMQSFPLGLLIAKTEPPSDRTHRRRALLIRTPELGPLFVVSGTQRG